VLWIGKLCRRYAAGALCLIGPALLVGCAARVPKPTIVTREQEDASRRKEIKALEKSLDEEIIKARANGATDADIEVLKSKYQAAIDRVKEELTKKDNVAPDVPKDAGP
jgi:hypothetical protein